jgi:hypothetical protein
MHNGKRRIIVMLGLGLLMMAMVFPASVAARPHRTVPADVAGAHTWTGQLCDGTAVSVAYHVTERGRLVFDEATGSRARVNRHHGWFRVRFVGERLRVVVWTHWRRGVLHLHTRVWQGECEVTPAPEPPPTDDPGNNSPPG